VAIFVEILTDNRNRTFSEVRKMFEKRGGNIGSSGCVAWMFEVKGFFTVEEESIPEDRMLELALEAGAEDMEVEDGLYQITSEPQAFDKVKSHLEEAGVKLKGAEITRIPKNTVPVEGKDGEKVLALLEELDDHDDVQAVHANLDLVES
jgi:YebC/PmpR family DNA-binding regulatory protein